MPPHVKDNPAMLHECTDEVICVALNYIGQFEQLETQFHKPPYMEPPRTPVLFIKPRNTIIGHQHRVQFPDGVDTIQPGPSLALVIGKRASRISAHEAMSYIEGYTIFNDFSLPEESFFRPAITSKCFDSFGPIGPAIIPRANIADPHDLGIKTYVNGELKQEANTDELIWSIPALVEFISSFKTLVPGDVIATGFPAGRVNVYAGDEVTVSIENLGELTNKIVTESEYYRQ